MTQSFAYRRRWGAEILDSGSARFRLWAPNVANVLLVSESESGLSMTPAGGGWFELETDRIRPGDGYAFRMARPCRIRRRALRPETFMVLRGW